MIVIGIDPGLKGGVAAINSRTQALPVVHDIPTFNKKEQNHAALAQLFRVLSGADSGCGQLLDLIHVGIEKVGARPGQAAQGVLKSGLNYGAILGVLTALDLPYTEFAPAKWKNTMLAGFGDKSDKHNSEKRACQLYPALAGVFRSSRGALLDGRCEALLIARYTMDQMIGADAAAA